MSFFSGFLTGMAKQYNANTAAQMKEEGELRALDYEYGKRAQIEKEKAIAAAKAAETDFENQMFMESIKATNDEILEGIKGKEQRKLERLKAKLEGTGGISYSLGSDSGGNPISVTLPNLYEGKSDPLRARNAITFFETKGPEVYQKLLEHGDPNQIRDFEDRLFNAVDFRSQQPDWTYNNPTSGRPVMLDRFGSIPNSMSIIMSSPRLQEKMAALVPDMDRRFRDRFNIPASSRVLTREVGPNGEDGVGYTNYPDYMRDEGGAVPEETVTQVEGIERNGGVTLDSAFRFFNESPAPKEKFERWQELDNLYAPIMEDTQNAPLISPSAKARGAALLSNVRNENPDQAFQYFLYMAANDEFPLSKEINITGDEQNMSAETVKKQYKVDPQAMRDRALASDRVVRFTSGIFDNLQRGGKYGISGKLQLFAQGAGEQFNELVQIGGDLISLFSNVQAANADDQKIRERQMRELNGIHQSLMRGDTVTETAMLKYYSTLLAYAMAVAVQGGDAAARTVSDQDVQRVADGVAPIGSGRNIISASEIYAITIAADHEMREQSVIYANLGSQNVVRTRAAHYYRETFAQRPANIRELMKMKLADSNPELYGRMFGDGSPTADQSVKGAGSKADAAISAFQSKSGGNNQKAVINPVNPSIPGPLGPTQQ